MAASTAEAALEAAAEVSLPRSSSKPEDLVARAIAPVKPQYLRPPPLLRFRNSSGNNDDNNKDAAGKNLSEKGGAGEEQNGLDSSDKKGDAGVVVVKEKKSKRQLKRERQQERKSVRNLCPEIARTGDVAACKFGIACRFSHDLRGFLEQRPEDLPGVCPFGSTGEPCPYGVACRFFGTHDPHPPEGSSCLERKTHSEVNALTKDLQRLLWKDKVKYPKADAQLRLLGILGDKGRRKSGLTDGISSCSNGFGILQENENAELGSDVAAADSATDCLEEKYLEDTSDLVEVRHPKKTKLPSTEDLVATESENCVIPVEANLDHDELENLASPRVEVAPVTDLREKKLIDFSGKLYLAPLTTVGNLPFRRVCKSLGADITCGEMAMCTNLLQGQASEWALMRRHSSEDLFGVQVCGTYPDTVAKTIELISSQCSIDFIDINMGCPIDTIVNKGAGSALLTKPMRMKNIIQVASAMTDKPLTVKVRTGFLEGRNRIDSLVADISKWGASAVTIHGRSRQQRYSKLADWDYIYECARKAPGSLQILGNGDIFSFLDWNKHLSDCPQLSSCMIARGALIKPWIFTEIKEQGDWDISSGERFDLLKKYVNFGLEHWGSDSKGVETTRHFLLEWLSYTCRYIPVGLLDVVPQRLNWRPPSYFGRDSLETLMASDSAADWIRISEMLLGKVPDGFTFAPKHKSNAYDRAENG